ncbi:MAG: CpsD/CapB family tyrosine-protein kinase [Clostridiales bacterium]|jgi:capsular exopolysaccharide synthesis family protein|nr:CpsD/CapB family tyrosine-protein kinase [Clostridiales bacterium]
MDVDNSGAGVSAVQKYQTPKAFMESYKVARANLIFSLFKEGCKKIVVTSSLPKEGKTITSVNLSIELAKQMNTRVLLLDCDLRKPRIHQFFGVNNVPGITDYILKPGTETLDKIVIKTHISDLSIICAGTLPPNPSEILTSVYFAEFLKRLEKDYDYIMVDTSPLNIVIDALSVIKLSDGVVLSAIQDVSVHPEFSKTVAAIRNIDAKILGVILHGVENSGKKKYYKYEYYN